LGPLPLQLLRSLSRWVLLDSHTPNLFRSLDSAPVQYCPAPWFAEKKSPLAVLPSTFRSPFFARGGRSGSNLSPKTPLTVRRHSPLDRGLAFCSRCYFGFYLSVFFSQNRIPSIPIPSPSPLAISVGRPFEPMTNFLALLWQSSDYSGRPFTHVGVFWWDSVCLLNSLLVLCTLARRSFSLQFPFLPRRSTTESFPRLPLPPPFCLLRRVEGWPSFIAAVGSFFEWMIPPTLYLHIPLTPRLC